VFFLASALLLSVPGLASEPPDEEIEKRLAELRYDWQDEELPVGALAIDLGKRASGDIPAEQAAEDVERLFHLFSHGYSGYAYFNVDGSFARARERILEELGTRAEWGAGELANLLREHLRFIRDCHTKIGGLTYGEHRDFWYDTALELEKVGDEFRLVVEGEPYVATSIAGGPPEACLRPSLNEGGEAVYRIGLLSSARPEPLMLEARGDHGARTFEIELRRSEFFSWSRDIFREDRIGGIPVLRIRSFSDHHSEDIERFLETADRCRKEPCIIVDLRGNGGGNERYVIEWIRRLTGMTAWPVFVSTELSCRTTMVGRANAMAYWHDMYPGTDLYREEAVRHTDLAKGFGGGGRAPFWSGPFHPPATRIPNETTLIIVTNGFVASAAEGFVMRASRADHVVVVGENTRGALTFGNVSAHQLPHSGLMVWLPINFGLFPDLVFREETGLAPDFWVPAPDAVNRAVAAVRRGTIPTARPVPRAWREQEFIPEDPNHRLAEMARIRLIVIGVAALAGLLWSYRMRRKPVLLAVLGLAYLAIGVAWLLLGKAEKPVIEYAGSGFLVFGALGLLCGAALKVRHLRGEERRAGGRARE